MWDRNREATSEITDDWPVSRRQFIVGGLVLGGASPLLSGSETVAAFHDSLSANGAVRIDGDPTLNYQIQDQTKNNNAEYEIFYQVEWVSNFQSIEIQAENIDDQNIDGDTFSKTATEGSVSYPRSGGSDGGATGDTYRFTFRVYKNGQASPLIEKTVEDQAEGTGSGDGDFGNTNSPELEWAIVQDGTKNNNASYTVYYEVKNTTNFGEILATFEDRDKSNATGTDTNTSSPTGELTYSAGGAGGHDFDIVLEVKNGNGLTVDTVTIQDVADGVAPSTHGDPVRPDSPKLDSFTVSDSTQNNNTNYSLTYQTADTDRFGGARIAFKNTQKDSATETVMRGSEAPSGSATYSAGGTEGHTYDITVEVLETRNGITFPIDSGMLTDVAGSGATTKAWPADA